MNKAILMGRLTREPEVRYAQNDNSTCIARFNLAVDRRIKQDTEPNADFISCVAFGKTAEFIEKYLTKGSKILLEGRIQTGSYTNKDGVKIYTTDVVAENVEFAESKGQQTNAGVSGANTDDGFTDMPSDEDLPFAAPTR